MLEKHVEYSLLQYCEDDNKILYNPNINNTRKIKSYMKECLEKLNNEKLRKTGNEYFSDNEFKIIIDKIEKSQSPVEFAKILNDKIEIKRDNGNIVYIKLIAPLKGDKNKNDIISINQVYINCTKEHDNRFDVVILVNGIPLIQIENKKPDQDVYDACTQLKRYQKEGCYKGIFSAIQIIGITNYNDTLYTINNEELSKESFKHWRDLKEIEISELEKFAFFFLNKNNIIKLFTEYSLLNSKEIEGKIEEKLLFAKPHQIHAADAIIKELEISNGCYIYHNMGAGKTYTAYFTIKKLKKTGKYSKIIFCTDRIDLDNQTKSVFKNAALNAAYINDTNTLIKELDNPASNIIITTMQKLNNASKKAKDKDNESIVILFDECHRSQSGSMQKNILDTYKNAKIVGFSGTPRTVENPDISDKTTFDRFGRCVHEYNMKTSVVNNTTLPLNIYGYKWVEAKEEISDKDKLVKGIKIDEIFESSDKVEKICKEIISKYKTFTIEKKYSSILTTDTISTALTYFKTFIKLKPNLKFAIVFSWGKNKDLADKEIVNNDDIEYLLKHYNNTFKTNFTIDTPNEYRIDIMNRLKSYSNTDNLDMVIVVDMLLTGFDAPRLNTIFIDKSMQAIDLMQSMQRTVRLAEDDKVYGNVIFFRNNTFELEKALRLYCGGGNFNEVIARKYEEVLRDLKDAFKKLIKIGTPSEIALIKDLKKKNEFVQKMRMVKNYFNEIKGEISFKWDDLKDVPITEDDFQGYEGQFKKAFREILDNIGKENVSVLNDINFDIKQYAPIKIDEEYIKNMAINKNKDENTSKNIKKTNKDLPEKAAKEKGKYLLNFIKSQNNKISAHKQKEKDKKFNKLKEELKILTKEEIEKIISIYTKQCQYDFSTEMDTITRDVLREIIASKKECDKTIQREIFTIAPRKIQEYCKEVKK